MSLSLSPHHAAALVLLLGNVLPAPASAGTPTVPPAPVIDNVLPGNGRVTVHYTLQGNGGSPIQGVIINCGAMTVFGGNNPLPVSGLANGVAVTCRMRAVNGVGNSAWSGDFGPVTPVGPPDLPTGLVATRGNGQVSLAFVPGDDGGLTATWHAQCGTQSTSGAAAPLLVSGLANGTSVSCEVWGTNSAGSGAHATADPVTPATVPGAPTLIAATAGDGSVQLEFAAPADDGGADISGYQAACTPGTHTSQGSSSPLTVGNLSNGETYVCSVSASNDVGSGSAAQGISIVPRFSADLFVGIDNGRHFLSGGRETSYLIQVYNDSSHHIAGVRVVDLPGAQFSGVSWVCSADAGSQCPASGSNGIDVSVDLAPGAGVNFLLTATVAALPEAPASNGVSITAPNSVADPVAGNDSAVDGPDVVGIFAAGFE